MGVGFLATCQIFLFLLTSLSCIVGVCFSRVQRQLHGEQQDTAIATAQYDGISKKGEEVLKKEWKVDHPDATILFTKEGRFLYLLSTLSLSLLFLTCSYRCKFNIRRQWIQGARRFLKRQDMQQGRSIPFI